MVRRIFQWNNALRLCLLRSLLWHTYLNQWWTGLVTWDLNSWRSWLKNFCRVKLTKSYLESTLLFLRLHPSRLLNSLLIIKSFEYSLLLYIVWLSHDSEFDVNLIQLQATWSNVSDLLHNIIYLLLRLNLLRSTYSFVVKLLWSRFGMHFSNSNPIRHHTISIIIHTYCSIISPYIVNLRYFRLYSLYILRFN